MTASKLMPTMRYADAPAMIEWLCEVLGFKRRMVVEGEGDMIVHAQLERGGDMIMLGSDRDDAFGKIQRQGEASRLATQSAYMVVDTDEDVDRLVKLVSERGGEILHGPESPPHGGRAFSFRDPGGQVWNIGSYNPWAE